MSFAILSLEGVNFLLRWLHIIFGVMWIGLLYYFNFVQGSFFAETDAATKSGAIQRLVPRALLWFRWAATLTLITGLVLVNGMIHTFPGSAADWMNSGGYRISIGMLFGIVMWINVWFVIWPNQKIVIQSALDVAGGKPANPAAAAAGARAGVASRTNVLFSVPMLFFMTAGSHLSMAPLTNAGLLFGVIGAIIVALELNALKGKTGPLTTVKGVIHMGFAFAAVVYVLVEVLK